MRLGFSITTQEQRSNVSNGQVWYLQDREQPECQTQIDKTMIIRIYHISLHYEFICL